MSKFRITLTKDPDVIAGIKARPFWPFEKGGVAFTEETVHECDDLTPFWSDPLIPGVVDCRLVVEEVKEEPPHGETVPS